MSARLRKMNAKKSRRYLLSAACWFWITVVVTVLAIFWEPLFSGLFIWGPDSSSFVYIERRYGFPASYLGWWDNLRGLGTGGFTQPMLPYHLVSYLMPALSIKPGIYIGSVLGTILAGIYWFRSYGLRGWPAYLASLALGLSAHTYSLISAGHDGKIHAWPFCILLLAAVNRALTRRALTRPSLFHFALAGYAAGVAFALQPDIALLFSFLASAYGLFLFLRHWPRESNQPTESRPPKPEDSPARGRSVPTGLLKSRIRYVGHNAFGVLLAGILLFCVSLSSVIFALTVVLPHREALASVVGTTRDPEQDKWEFATNWSLPPEEILEFVAPCVFGIQTGDSRGPYWGRLGRTLGWEQHHQGLMNLRGHTVYLGVIQIVFAIYAVVWALRSRIGHWSPVLRSSSVTEGGLVIGYWKGKRQERDERHVEKENIEHLSSEVRGAKEDRTSNIERRRDIFFWAGVLLVSVLLALGRYFPLYRLFYLLFPYAASIRAPVKFLHLAEVSLCILFAFGLDAFLAGLATRRAPGVIPEHGKSRKRPGSSAIVGIPSAEKRIWRFFGFACAGIGIMFLFSIAVVSAQESALVQIWNGFGMGSYSESLMNLMTGALVRATALFLVCAAAFLVAAYGSSHFIPRALPVVLLIVLALDLGSVLKRYITVWDEYDRFIPSELIARLGSNKTNYRVALPVRGGLYDVWRNYNFPKHWITTLDSENFGALSAEDRAFYETLGRNPIRLWQLTSTKNILGPAGSLAPLTNSAAMDVVDFFNVMGDGSVQWTGLGQGQHVWLRLKTVLPRAAVYPAEYVEGKSWTNRLADPTWNPAQSVIVTGASAGRQGGLGQGRCEPAEIVSYKPNRVEIAARSGSGGILMLNERFDPNWEVFLDGKAAPLLRCNGVMRGVDLPAGEHRVVFLYRPAWGYFAANMAGTLILLVWGAARLWSLRRARSMTAEGSGSSLAEYAT